jgi:thiosulfate/3-mercaptopyruvate sulfurtransferase
MTTSPIIEVDELLKIYQQSDVMIFDASNGKNAKANYETEHLEGACFVDLNTQLADIKSDFADGGGHPLPTIESFAQTLSDLGISKDKHVVIHYDNNGSNASARFWWMLKSVGHEKVQVLKGGLNQAKKTFSR